VRSAENHFAEEKINASVVIFAETILTTNKDKKNREMQIYTRSIPFCLKTEWYSNASWGKPG
jgi:hypothetical protein